MTAIRTLGVDDWREWREVRLLALTESPAAFSATLADWQGAGDTEARWRERLQEVPYNALAHDGEVLLGQVSGVVTDDPTCVELISMYVVPDGRGTGVGDALIEAVCTWASTVGAARVVLGVRSTNSHAIALYERRGFRREAECGRSDCDVTMSRQLG